MRPRLESWKGAPAICGVSSAPGSARSRERSDQHDIATLSNDIVAGKHGGASVSNARHMRRAAAGLFNWAAEAGRDYVTASPCVNCQSLTPSMRARGSCPRTRSGFSGTASIGTTCPGTADPPRAQVRAGHHAALQRTAWRTPRASCSTSAARIRALTSRSSGSRSGGSSSSRCPIWLSRSSAKPDQRQAAMRLCQPARRSADEPQGDGNRVARHEERAKSRRPASARCSA